VKYNEVDLYIKSVHVNNPGHVYDSYACVVCLETIQSHTHTHINEEGEAKLAARKQPKRVHEVKL
jgi:hypothetical protein